MRNPRNPSTTRRPRSVVELCAGIRGGWRGEGRAGMQRGHDGQRFYHPVEFIKKNPLLTAATFNSLPRSTTRDPPRSFSSRPPSPRFILSFAFPFPRFIDYDPSPPPSSTLPFHTLCPERIRQREAKAQTRTFFSRVILAIFARGRARCIVRKSRQ